MQLGQSSRDDKFADEVAYNSNDFIAVCFDDQKARSPEAYRIQYATLLVVTDD